MPTIGQAASAFLANKRVAVTGVSSTPPDHGANRVCIGGCAMFGPTADLGHKVYTLHLRPERPQHV